MSDPLTTDQLSIPGPWRLNDPANAHVLEANDGYCVIEGDGKTEHLRVTGFFPLDVAHVIKAAPDLFAVLNELHSEFDQQTYLEMSRLDNDPPDDAEFSVNVTAKQLRAINQAILKAEGKL